MNKMMQHDATWSNMNLYASWGLLVIGTGFWQELPGCSSRRADQDLGFASTQNFEPFVETRQIRTKNSRPFEITFDSKIKENIAQILCRICERGMVGQKLWPLCRSNVLVFLAERHGWQSASQSIQADEMIEDKYSFRHDKLRRYLYIFKCLFNYLFLIL
jgi:hypothetical protein